MAKKIRTFKLNSDKKYSFYTTKNLIKILAEEIDLPEEAISSAYYHYIDNLHKHLKNPDIVAYRLGRFGSLVQTAPGIRKNLRALEQIKEPDEYIKNIKENYRKKADKATEIILDGFERTKSGHKSPLLKRGKPVKNILNE